MRIRCFLFLGLLFVSIARAETVPAPAEFERVRSFIEESIAQRESPSVVITVLRDGAAVWSEGFGFANIETGLKASPDLVYPYASISKPFTATGIMVLRDQGLLDLDQPANAYLPGAKLRARVGSPDDITVRLLTTHYSGIPNFFKFIYEGMNRLPYEEALERYGWAANVPGSVFDYSEINYMALGYIIESLTKTPWYEFTKATLLDPLKMKSGAVDVNPYTAQDTAQRYFRQLGGRFVPVPAYVSNGNCASGLWGTANDLARFGQMHLNRGELDGVRVLSEATVDEMIRQSGQGMARGARGIGWVVDPIAGRRAFSHYGGMPGCNSQLLVFPDDRVVAVILYNTWHSEFGVRLQEALMRALFFSDAPDADLSPRTPPPHNFERFAGHWKGTFQHDAETIPVEIVVRGEGAPTIQFAYGKALALQDPRARHLLKGYIDAPLIVMPGYSGNVPLHLELTIGGDRLYGYAFAELQNHWRVPFWMDLRRAPAEP